MYPTRPESQSPSGHRSPVHRRSDSFGDLQSQPQTSLPSIRHLHLPPPGMSQYAPSASEPAPGTYTYPAPPHFSAQHEQGPPVGTLHPVTHSDDAFIADSEIEETEQPPKKKRRRQALSCTECKRRKIKCDRSQPCGPCSRRGEQAKCQWHIVEPMVFSLREKYVTRSEYEELRTRVDQLESLVHRLTSTSSSPYLATSVYMGQAPSAGYQSVIPQHLSPQHVEPLPPPSSVQRYPKIDPPLPHDAQQPQSQHARAHGQAHHQPILAANPMGASSPTVPAMPGPTSSSQPRSPPQGSTSTQKKSPLSLAAITSPYPEQQPPPSQPKNFRAQTLILGERLRQGSLAHEGPAGVGACRRLSRVRVRTTRRARQSALCCLHLSQPVTPRLPARRRAAV
ncbi:hypothetical protein HGRIS_004154 [Hohenbuehelia grisea]|uniref:Zn(2)-C6 fungal-type domain-containing protein n=1 Tax=Hohenbuehelia grisea TaxID=104357 RepID=A0ABR3JHR3_9AGAR